jgi:hypothetical protein
MLLGVNLSVFDIGAIFEGDFYSKFLLKNKEDGFTWALYVVYGPAQDGEKVQLLRNTPNDYRWGFQYYEIPGGQEQVQFLSPLTDSF